jgi:hypothetical protein
MEIIEQYIIEEIKYLRNEILHYNNIQNATIGIGLTFLSTMVKIGLDNNNSLLFEIIFLYGIPIISFITLMIWIGAVNRTVKAARYVFYREKEIRAGENVIFWETWLRRKENGFTYINYFAIISLFLGIEIVSIIYGLRNIELVVENLFISFSLFFISYFFIFFKGLNIITELNEK